MPLPRDVGIGKDDFQKSTVFSQTDSLVNYILNILLMKPGNLPNLPEIGADLKKFIHGRMDDIDTEMIKGLIASNCSDLLPFLSTDTILVEVRYEILEDGSQGRPVLVIAIPITKMDDAGKASVVYYGFYRDELNEIKFDFIVDEAK